MRGKRALIWALIVLLCVLPVQSAQAADTATFLDEAYAFAYGETATVGICITTGKRLEWTLRTEAGETLSKLTVPPCTQRYMSFRFKVDAHFARRTVLLLYRSDREEPQSRTLLFCDAPQNGALWQVACSERLLAITFDAANSAVYTKNILDVLDRCNAKATFFVIGRFVEANPELCREIVARGHELASHSYEHLDMHAATAQEAYRSISRTDALIRACNGDTRVLYRPPSGKSSFRDRAIARGLGSEVIRWSVDSGDGFTYTTYNSLIQRMKRNMHNGGIALMHVYGEHTLKALTELLPYYAHKGYRFVTVSDLLLDGETYIDEWGTQYPLHHEPSQIAPLAGRLAVPRG